MDGHADGTNVPTLEPDERATFERDVKLRLDALQAAVERVLTLVCPVCGPDLIRQIHPEADWHARAEWDVLVKPSNGEHGS